MTVRDAAVLMMIISDNAATNMCIDLVGLEQVNETMRVDGLPSRRDCSSRLGDRAAGLDARKMSVSSAGDICGLMTLIARHEAVSADASEDMLRIMRRCNGRAELSHLLPWNEMNMLENPRENWVAEKGGAFINGIRTGGVDLPQRARLLRDVGVRRRDARRAVAGQEAEGNQIAVGDGQGRLGRARVAPTAPDPVAAQRRPHRSPTITCCDSSPPVAATASRKMRSSFSASPDARSPSDPISNEPSSVSTSDFSDCRWSL